MHAPGSYGEYKAKNNICFLFALMIRWGRCFQQVGHERLCEQCSKLSGT